MDGGERGTEWTVVHVGGGVTTRLHDSSKVGVLVYCKVYGVRETSSRTKPPR